MGHCAVRPGVGVRGRPRVGRGVLTRTGWYELQRVGRHWRAAVDTGSGGNAAHAARVRSRDTGWRRLPAHTGAPIQPQRPCPIRLCMDARQTLAPREPQSLGDIGLTVGAPAIATAPAMARLDASPSDAPPAAPAPAAPAPNSERDARWADWLTIAAAQPHSEAARAAAFASFYAQSAALALAFIRKSGGGTWCEDILTETYLQAWKDVAQFDPARGRASTWLLTIARSRCLDKLRFEALRRGVDAPQDGTQTDAEAPTAQAIDPNPGPDALLAATQNHRRLHAALATLSAPERWVLGLAFYQDLSHSEIAHTTRLPLGSVKSHIARGQRKLRELLQDAHPAGVAVKPKVSSHD